MGTLLNPFSVSVQLTFRVELGAETRFRLPQMGLRLRPSPTRDDRNVDVSGRRGDVDRKNGKPVYMPRGGLNPSWNGTEGKLNG